jgi:hypothetical protein
LPVDAIGTGSDGYTDHPVETNGLDIDFFQYLRGFIGVGEGLKIDDEFPGLVTFQDPLDTVFDLFPYGQFPPNEWGGGSTAVTVDTSPDPLRAIPVGTGKPRIHGDPVNLLSKRLLQIIAETIIGKWHRHFFKNTV